MSENIDSLIQYVHKTAKFYRGFAQLEEELKKLQNLDQREKSLKSGIAKAQKEKDAADAELGEQVKKLDSEKKRLKTYVENKTKEAEKIVSDAKDKQIELDRAFTKKVEAHNAKVAAQQEQVDGMSSKYLEGKRQLAELEGKIEKARSSLTKILNAVG